MCEEEKYEENWADFRNKISQEVLKRFPSILNLKYTLRTVLLFLLAFWHFHSTSTVAEGYDSSPQGIPGVVYFINDILITGCTHQEHESNLRQVLSRLQLCSLGLNKAKCHFFQEELEFLGHVISREGVQPTYSRIKVIQKAPAPTNKQQL